MTINITRREAADILCVTMKTIYQMEKAGRIPTPKLIMLNERSGRNVIGYNRKLFSEWAETNPIRHAGYLDSDERKDRCKKSQPHESDIYNIQRKGSPFIYSGYAKWWILNFQPALLNRGLKYD
jgi:hypothetical protein